MCFIFAVLAFLLAGCSSSVQTEISITASPVVATGTLPLANTPVPSESPPPPLPSPTVAPVDGVTSTEVNVRLQPSTTSDVLGVIPAEMRVEITGRDPGGNWWQIEYPHPGAIDGKGWVSAQFVTTANADEVPIVGVDPGHPDQGSMAVVQDRINVRSGPGTDYDSLGTLNPQDVVSLIGKDPAGTWLQIEFPQGGSPEGTGWVSAAFVQAQGVENLPIVTESGIVIGTGTPTVIPPTPTATVVPARQDHDSADNPLAQVTFDPTATTTFLYNGDVSAPDGDIEDWIQFTSFSERNLLEVDCSSDTLIIEIIQHGQVIEQASCPAEHVIQSESEMPVLIHVRALTEEGLRYSTYNLKVRAIP